MSDLDALAERRAERARARSSDSGRSGYSRLFGSDSRPGQVVRCSDCKDEVTISAHVADLARLACSALARRGIPPLKWSEVTRCPPCGIAWSARMTQERLSVSSEGNRMVGEIKARGGPLTASERSWLNREGWADFVKEWDARSAADEQRTSSRRRADK
jgi:hypothetical protein